MPTKFEVKVSNKGAGFPPVMAQKKASSYPERGPDDESPAPKPKAKAKKKKKKGFQFKKK